MCPAPDPDIRLTVPFVAGVVLVILSTFILLHCYRVLGRHFTYHLTIRDKHELITTQLYSYVRHPSYSGTLILIAGIPLSHVTSGSWLVECGFLNPHGVSVMIVWAAWWLWGAVVCVRRARAEDAQLRKEFGKRWDSYAEKVPRRFIPGLL
jgi:protein-S-isoprenylcysteine O-methyltransferase Ste14